MAELYELIILHRQFIIPMEFLAQLSKISSLELPINETLKAKYMALILREYRKFKEVSAVRDQKQMAMEQLQVIKNQNSPIRPSRSSIQDMQVVQEYPTAEGFTSDNSTDHIGMTRSQIIPIAISASNLDTKSAKSKKSTTKIRIQENTSNRNLRNSLS